MNIEEPQNSKELKLQAVIDRYLQINSFSNDFESGDAHLDEDSLSAFVEGNLTEQEAAPIINHLVACSYCRHVSAELVRLDLAFAKETQEIVATNSEPTRVADVLNGVLSKIFGTNDSAVFAHNEEKRKDVKEEEDKIE